MANTRHKIKVTRSSTGVFKLYVDDVLIGTATDNTVTTGECIYINADAGDKVNYSDIDGGNCIIKGLKA